MALAAACTSEWATGKHHNRHEWHATTDAGTATSAERRHGAVFRSVTLLSPLAALQLKISNCNGTLQRSAIANRE